VPRAWGKGEAWRQREQTLTAAAGRTGSSKKWLGWCPKKGSFEMGGRDGAIRKTTAFSPEATIRLTTRACARKTDIASPAKKI